MNALQQHSSDTAVHGRKKQAAVSAPAVTLPFPFNCSAMAAGPGSKAQQMLRAASVCADICVSCALQTLRAVLSDYVDLPDEIRPFFEHPEFAKEFSDLLEWRDAIFAKHWPSSEDYSTPPLTPSTTRDGLSTGSTVASSSHVLFSQ